MRVRPSGRRLPASAGYGQRRIRTVLPGEPGHRQRVQGPHQSADILRRTGDHGLGRVDGKVREHLERPGVRTRREGRSYPERGCRQGVPTRHRRSVRRFGGTRRVPHVLQDLGVRPKVDAQEGDGGDPAGNGLDSRLPGPVPPRDSGLEHPSRVRDSLRDDRLRSVAAVSRSGQQEIPEMVEEPSTRMGDEGTWASTVTRCRRSTWACPSYS